MQATVKERPILFSAPMVHAILNGTKTQTRRIVKPQPPDDIDALHGNDFRNRAPYSIECDDGRLTGQFGFQYDDQVWTCPYGQAGERLWVRETWRRIVTGLNAGKCDYYADDPGASGLGFMPWKPSIHMPRKDSRINLEVTGVRVERLHSIGKDGRKAADVLAEGITREQIDQQAKWFHADDAPALAYAALWNKINGDGSWESNPWVWVIEFKKAEGT